MTGRTADGESITCEDNDGWRWEPERAPAASKPPSVAPTRSCYPVSDEGTCYQPGEFCRDSDHGVTGRTAEGESITCEDNDGWRWEPA